MKKSQSMQIQALKESMNESPPPPPPNASIREWFAGLALSNPVLMSDIENSQRVTEAVRLADELINALAVPRVPEKQSMRAPTKRELKAWERNINDKSARASRVTDPAVPSARRGILPPAPTEVERIVRRASDNPPPVIKRSLTPGVGRYFVSNNAVETESKQ